MQLISIAFHFINLKRIDDSGKDGGHHFTQCMIGICPPVTHSYQNLQLQHKILITATIDAGRRDLIEKIYAYSFGHLKSAKPSENGRLRR